ncbi:MAG: hypothetical protein ACE5GR_00305 [Nitrosopumilus sp.]
MLVKSMGLLGIFLVLSVSFTSIFALTELQRATIDDPRLEVFGAPLGNFINVDQQIQISADVTNHQVRSQNFVYLVQIKNEIGVVVFLGWISGQLTPDQQLSPSLSWTPNESGEFVAEIFVWEGLNNHNALSEYTTLQINVS